MAKLSIILVNYKTPQDTIACIDSIYKTTLQKDFEIIVIDNHSQDFSKELVQQKFPQVFWIDMGYNAGFARANNKGMKAATGDFFLLLNPDTIVHEGAIDGCLSFLMQEGVAAAGVQLLNEDGSAQMSGWDFGWKGSNVLVRLPYMKSLYDSIRRSEAKLRVADNEYPKVDFINGAFLMVKKSAVLTVGYLDESFFLYAEEAEWCSRLSAFGSLHIVGGLYVTHLQGNAANKAYGSAGKGYFNLFDKKGLQFMVSEWLRIAKQYGPFFLSLYYFIYVFYIIPFLFVLMVDTFVNGNRRSYSFQQYMAYVKNVFTCFPYILRMITGKQYFYKVY